MNRNLAGQQLSCTCDKLFTDGSHRALSDSNCVIVGRARSARVFYGVELPVPKRCRPQTRASFRQKFDHVSDSIKRVLVVVHGRDGYESGGGCESGAGGVHGSQRVAAGARAHAFRQGRATEYGGECDWYDFFARLD